jgi:uncharacterized protein YjiS (DUF1127 family)
MSTIDTINACCETRDSVEQRRGLSGGVSAVLTWLRLALAKRRSRMHLSELSDDQLRDIGKTRREARGEFLRSFWD